MSEINEALNYSQRIKKAQTLRKYSTKIQMARQRARKKIAGTDQLVSRSRRAAIKAVRKIVAGKLGMNYNELSVSQKMQIDAKVAAKGKLVDVLSRKMLPRIRKAELDRFSNMKKPVNEETIAENNIPVGSFAEFNRVLKTSQSSEDILTYLLKNSRKSINTEVSEPEVSPRERAKRLDDGSDDY